MKKIGRYTVISELGRGAMGIVYKASDPTIGREVALKVLSLINSPEEGANSSQQMFMREVRAAGRLAHPSIVTIHDAFDDADTQNSCIVMELVPGVTLEKILGSGHTLPTEQTLNLVRQVAEGLDYAHRNQVIHRDLKPANILVTEDGRAKITDFGIAKVLAREGVARTVGILGTPSYMSPEQVTGGEVDARTDIFSLGILIYTMLTGKKPFSGNTAVVMFQIVYEEPSAASSLNPQLTPEHDYVVKRCLSKDRDRRYSSARELLGDLDDLQHGRPPRSQAAAPAPGAAPPAAPPPERTVAMPISGLMKAVSQQPAPPSAPPAPPSASHQQEAVQPPKPVTPAPRPPVEAGGPVAPPATERTVAMPISGLMKGMSQPPSPAVVSAPPVQPPKPVIPPPVTPAPEALPLTGQTLPMRVPDFSAVRPPSPPSPYAATPPSASGQTTMEMERPVHMRVPDHSSASQAAGPQQATPVGPPAITPWEADGSVTPPQVEQTLAMPIKGLMKGASQSPPSRAVSAPPAPSPVPVRPPRPAIPPPVTSALEAFPLTGQTLPRRVPDLSAVKPPSPPLPQAPPPPSASDQRTLMMERTLPVRGPDSTSASPGAGPQPTPLAPPLEPVAAEAVEPAGSPDALLPAPKSKLIPAMVGGMALVLVTVGMWGYWKFHQTRTPSPPPQVAVMPPATPPPVPAPLAAPTPPPPTATAEPTPAEKTTQEVAKKTAVHKPKPAIVPSPSTPAPTPPPAQPQPVIVTPPPQPKPPPPSPEDIAKAEADRLAKIPRIVKVLCNYGLKEATFVFSTGGKPLFEETLKGKKVKGGFLGIKGSYQGTFSQTITVPAGMSEVSVRVIGKDGGTDMNKAIKMPPPGGFVPTLAVEVDNEHVSLNWQSPPAAK